MTARAHGTRVKYVVEHCRCAPCRDASRRYERERLARHRPMFRIRHVGGGRWIVCHQRRGTLPERFTARADASALCDAMNAESRALGFTPEPLWAAPGLVTSVRRELRSLAARGVGLRRVAMLLGCSRSRLLELVHDRSYHPNRPRHRRLKFVTAQRILGLGPAGTPAPGAIVPAADTWRRVEVLRTRGLSKAAIARALGKQTPALQLGRERVLARNAAAVAALTGGC
jgi:hypothetical protein